MSPSIVFSVVLSTASKPLIVPVPDRAKRGVLTLVFAVTVVLEVIAPTTSSATEGSVVPIPTFPAK